MANALRQVREAFDAHVGFTEREGGLYEDILEAAPRLAGAVRAGTRRQRLSPARSRPGG